MERKFQCLDWHNLFHNLFLFFFLGKKIKVKCIQLTSRKKHISGNYIIIFFLPNDSLHFLCKLFRFLMLEPQEMENFVLLHKEQPIRRQVPVSTYTQSLTTQTNKNRCTNRGFVSLFVSDGHYLYRDVEEEHGR